MLNHIVIVENTHAQFFYKLDQEVAGSTPAKVGNILLSRLIMKYFLLSFSPFR